MAVSIHRKERLPFCGFEPLLFLNRFFRAGLAQSFVEFGKFSVNGLVSEPKRQVHE